MQLLSTFGGGLWIIPVLMIIGAGIFFWMGKYKSVYFYWFSAALTLAAIITFFLMRADR